MRRAILLFMASVVACALLFHHNESAAAEWWGAGKIKTRYFYEGHIGVLVIQENRSDLAGSQA